MCTSGPRDRKFEEQHDHIAIAMVVAGTFQYRSAAGCDLMTPGSLMLGNSGQCFECGHEHACGDRCISFHYSPEHFERITEQGAGRPHRFGLLRVPPVRELSPLLVRACARLGRSPSRAWEEISVELAGIALQLAQGEPAREPAASTVSRVTRVVRRIERDLDSHSCLADLAKEAGLSLYHFLRTFEQLTGVTPHQYVRRIRLQAAAAQLVCSETRVLDVALDCGFGDVSNFNHAFREEFGVSPRQFRRGNPTEAISA